MTTAERAVTRKERAHELWLSLVNELLTVDYIEKNGSKEDKEALVILLEDAIKTLKRNEKTMTCKHKEKYPNVIFNGIDCHVDCYSGKIYWTDKYKTMTHSRLIKDLYLKDNPEIPLNDIIKDDKFLLPYVNNIEVVMGISE